MRLPIASNARAIDAGSARSTSGARNPDQLVSLVRGDAFRERLAQAPPRAGHDVRFMDRIIFGTCALALFLLRRRGPRPGGELRVPTQRQPRRAPDLLRFGRVRPGRGDGALLLGRAKRAQGKRVVPQTRPAGMAAQAQRVQGRSLHGPRLSRAPRGAHHRCSPGSTCAADWTSQRCRSSWARSRPKPISVMAPRSLHVRAAPRAARLMTTKQGAFVIREKSGHQTIVLLDIMRGGDNATQFPVMEQVHRRCHDHGARPPRGEGTAARRCSTGATACTCTGLPR